MVPPQAEAARSRSDRGGTLAGGGTEDRRRSQVALAPEPPARRGWLHRLRWPIAAVVLVLVAGLWALGFYWSREPDVFWVNEKTPDGHRAVVGYSTVNTLIDVIDWLLDKPGGYLSNDVLPPGVWLDNMPSFEFGVLTQCRDLARVLRNDYSRSQSQSIEDDDLAIAEPALNTDNRQLAVAAGREQVSRGRERAAPLPRRD